MRYDQLKAIYDLYIANIHRYMRSDCFRCTYLPDPTITNVRYIIGEDLSYLKNTLGEKIPQDSYGKTGGFYSPVLLLEEDNGYCVMDGNHRYYFINEVHPEFTILALILPKDSMDIDRKYDIIVPEDWVDIDPNQISYRLTVADIPCVRLLIEHDIRLFCKIFSLFTDRLFLELKKHNFSIRADWNINHNILLDKPAYARLSAFHTPKFQYYDENSKINHYTLIDECNITKDFVISLYKIYVSNLKTSANKYYLWIDKDFFTKYSYNKASFSYIKNSKEKLIESVSKIGIVMPVVYNNIEDGIITFGDGAHRIQAIEEVINQNPDRKFLCIKNARYIFDKDLPIIMPKFLYDKYSYILQSKNHQSSIFDNIEIMIINTRYGEDIRFIEIAMERELNYLFESGYFDKYDICGDPYINGLEVN